MRWTTGEAEIERLLDQGSIERVQGAQADGESWLERARRSLDAARMLVQAAPDSSITAGLILSGTFASLVLAGNSILQQIGFAVAAGIALAAFVMAMFFAPSLTALVGNRAWWPGHQGDRR